MAPLIEACRLRKTYPGVVALRDVDFSVEPGEVRALLGLNGAGKSTLVRVLSGATTPEEGTLKVDGTEVRFTGPLDAQRAGLGTVFQEFSLVPGLTVEQNITLGRWNDRSSGPLSLVDRRYVRKTATRALELLGIGDSLARGALVEELSVSQQQLVECAKAVAMEPKLLILDEPTSSLSSHEVEVLLALVRRLADQGVAVIYVSHRMKEIPRVADSVTVLRDGSVAGNLPIAEATTEAVARLMVGEERRGASVAREILDAGEPVLEVDGLTKRGYFSDISFILRRREVIGIAGLLGSGRTSVLRCLMGLEHAESGSVRVGGEDVLGETPGQMLRRGVAMAPEDRRRMGFVAALGVRDNIVMASLHELGRLGVRSREREDEVASRIVERLSVATPSLHTAVSGLSGGTQQKVVIGKYVAANATVLLLDEPTRGIDVHARAQLYQIMDDLAAEGKAIVLVSDEFEELLDHCDRILVMNQGRIVEELTASEATMTKLLRATMQDVQAMATT